MASSFKFALTIRSDTRYLAVLRDFVRAASKIAGHENIKHNAVQALCIALTEAVDNAIVHAHGRKKSLPIRVSFAISKKRVVIEVIDQGRGIECIWHREPPVFACKGRGLFLIRRMMKKVKSTKTNGQHKLRMVLHI